ncbi:hypothetical protein AS189_18895 [Arthrobacter alpinus]|uniref:site-specific DNA-methyltransferase (adenine-specific) n=1 Tax=Arthrobacter alpinus TaxID=656366 RepID=A0A0S2M3P6_9MICC|nr:BREX-1 system adenine-specific DNA-methyltransferase PglX [Arthrobacter alpinus]ALO68188.1 hypothetical protein AS189_18895 [Arthrobacter alpinus]
MDTKPLERFATQARRELIASVEARAAAVLAVGSVERSERGQTVKRLEAEIAQHGQKHVIDKVAYTWFNRLIALRYMDARGYTSARVVSPAQGHAHGQPEILADAKRGHLDTEVVTTPRTREAVMGLLEGTRRSTDAEGEAYALLLTEYCRFWNKAMPFMFEREGDYTELLVPSGLLADGAFLSRAHEVLNAEVCEDVEVIGWLYQFYVSERKDEVFAGFKKNKKAGADEIPAATQLFTPHWIVRYLVENSLGRLWMLNRPTSRLVDQMDYYIAPVDEETAVLKITEPEELTVIDPACGSGHMLTYAFDLLYAIYEEEGYAPSVIPSLILAHNLHGTEIDPRAGALAGFALTMKARAKDRRFFARDVDPQICVIEPLSFAPDELDFLVTKSGDRHTEETFWNQFRDADTLGSLIQPDGDMAKGAAEVLSILDDDLLYGQTLEYAHRVVHQAEVLSTKYTVVIANPPYMGGKQMGALLSQFMKDQYPTGKADLMTAFMIRAQELTVHGGTWAMINLPSWMSLKSFEDLRHDLIENQRIVSMVHLGRGVFGSDFGSVAFVIDNVSAKSSRGVYRRLFEKHVDVRSVSTIEALFSDSSYNRYEVLQEDFAAIPGSPIVYWLSEKMRGAFATGRPLSDVANLRQGLATADNNRFLRLWWEVSDNRTALTCTSREEAASSGARWFPYNKGGEFRKWYGNHEYVLNWEHDGAEIRNFGTEKGGRPRSRAQNTSTYFSPSVSWSDISSGEAAFRRFPSGFIHDVKGMSAFGSEGLLDQVAVLMNSSVAREVLKAIAPTLNFQVGDVGKLPVASGFDGLPANTGNLVETSRTDWDLSEMSWNFERNPLVALA